jgi:hypothetical protein
MGPVLEARRISDDKKIYRDPSHFKLANALVEAAMQDDY